MSEIYPWPADADNCTQCHMQLHFVSRQCENNGHGQTQCYRTRVLQDMFDERKERIQAAHNDEGGEEEIGMII